MLRCRKEGQKYFKFLYLTTLVALSEVSFGLCDIKKERDSILMITLYCYMTVVRDTINITNLILPLPVVVWSHFLRIITNKWKKYNITYQPIF